MTDNIRLPDELGRALQAQRKSLRMGKSELAQRAGKVRDVVYRLEAGEDTTVSSLMAVLAALGLERATQFIGQTNVVRHRLQSISLHGDMQVLRDTLMAARP